jgi:hypothetical protein
MSKYEMRSVMSRETVGNHEVAVNQRHSLRSAYPQKLTQALRIT